MAFVDTPETQKANRRFIRNAMKIPLLERDEEQELATAWRDNGDEGALHKLVTPYMRLVISTATRYRSYGLPIGDLVQEGNIGLMQAAAKFEPEREVRFSTYATWWIRSSMQEYVLRNWSIVRTGTTAAQKSLFFNLRRLRARIEDGSGVLTDANRQEIATCLNVPLRDVLMMEGRMSGSDRSLNTPVGENGESQWQDFLADDGADPEEQVMDGHDTQVRSRWIETAVAELNPREQTIIRRRRLSEDGQTLEVLGQHLGISKERVRQIEQEAMKKLKNALQRQAGDTRVMAMLPA
ncbi:MAG: RNA polymerase factor sigma-32 [Alphaproteobacteria bacterium]|mgnify:FL=1|jgi:RNA polymerase sigma-32 factor|nr:RNA polymerase factor sigma-32 [Alphaproteobacteria bacterium]MBT4967149.1 RNA polymerase factor sigma-32 [Alphaproteobacteria bacterium]MBT5158516.1 RNA polymerase factor sigma-32 [Alphaproteobacteria bacterium]MBT5920373.1 RNA polymerase factor sigma-32 [Alphaproteobacteria bacterium]MBT6384831.1 RNA polymerase factor sigma-32 [Alphaproteobacteria bacterium]